MIETSELPLLAKMTKLPTLPPKITKPILAGMSSLLIQESKSPEGVLLSLPLFRASPLIVIDQEALFRSYVDPGRLPTFWSELQKIVEQLKIKSPGSGFTPLGMSLEGDESLWLFEALHGKPLWERTRGGIKIPPDVSKTLTLLREWIDRGLLSTREENWKDLAKSFLDRKTGMMLASTDWLPFLTEQINFRWTAVPLPLATRERAHANQKSQIGAGSQLLILSDQPKIWEFVQYLYSPPILARLSIAGGFAPLKISVQQSPAWKNFKQTQPKSAEVLSSIRFNRARFTDLEILRVRDAWSKTLGKVLKASSMTPSEIERTLSELEATLSGSTK